MPLVGHRDADKLLSFDESGFNEHVRLQTAIIPVLKSATRLANTESFMYAFLRSRPVHQALIDSEIFDEQYPPSEKRQRDFIETIMSTEIASIMRSLLRIFTVIRRYLRVFDSDSCHISEVYPLTMCLERKLRSMLLNSFLTAERIDALVNVFTKSQSKQSQSGKRFHLLADIHEVAYLLDPNDCPGEYKKHMKAFNIYAMVYASGLNIAEKSSFAVKLTITFQEINDHWQKEIIIDHERKTLELYKRRPLLY